MPLSTLLGQLVVAATIEADDLFEQRMPHSTTLDRPAAGSPARPWLVSYVMWSNVLRHVDAAGTPTAELRRRAAVSINHLSSRLNGLTRWGYVTVEPPAAASSSRFTDQVVSLTADGRRAAATFTPLPELVEQRWADRFGTGTVDRLRRRLGPFLADAPTDLPRFLPVIGGDMVTEVELDDGATPTTDAPGDRDLLTQLAQVQLLLTLEVERESVLSLPLLANVVRVLDRTPTPATAIPGLTGVSKEAVAMSVTALKAAGLIDVAGSGAAATLALNDDGRRARTAARRRVASVERAWSKRGDLDALRRACEDVLAQGEGAGSAMAEGLRPHDGAWRNHRRYRPRTDALLADPRAALPYHPMVLHRGGYPDGS